MRKQNTQHKKRTTKQHTTQMAKNKTKYNNINKKTRTHNGGGIKIKQ